MSNRIYDIYRGSDGMLWFATEDGVSRYDGESFSAFTKEDGLADNCVLVIHGGSDGTLWFGTKSGGVVGYDGNAFTSLDTRDGLLDNAVYDIYEDSEGYLWLGTGNGITRYKRSSSKPSVYIVLVQTDKTYTSLSAIPPITAGGRVTIEYDAIDFKTHPEKQQYRYRIRENESQSEIRNPYSLPTKNTSFEWRPQKAGAYIFEVQAIDRGLNYSEKASVTLKVVPPWYLNGWIAIPSGGAILALLFFQFIFVSRYYAKRRESRRFSGMFQIFSKTEGCEERSN